MLKLNLFDLLPLAVSLIEPLPQLRVAKEILMHDQFVDRLCHDFLPLQVGLQVIHILRCKLLWQSAVLTIGQTCWEMLLTEV